MNKNIITKRELICNVIHALLESDIPKAVVLESMTNDIVKLYQKQNPNWSKKYDGAKIAINIWQRGSIDKLVTV